MGEKKASITSSKWASKRNAIDIWECPEVIKDRYINFLGKTGLSEICRAQKISCLDTRKKTFPLSYSFDSFFEHPKSKSKDYSFRLQSGKTTGEFELWSRAVCFLQFTSWSLPQRHLVLTESMWRSLTGSCFGNASFISKRIPRACFIHYLTALP